jgi:hypothetical protein
VPGASPYQAVEAFLAPLERAVACLGTGKIVVSPGGRATTGKTHLWNLNGGDGLVLRGDAAGCRFLASMHYRVVPTDPEKYEVEQGRWRVTTLAYLYEFRTPDNAKLWAMHWHPAGRSHATFPHLHLYSVRPDGHFVTPRQTLESAVQWCIEMGAAPQNPQRRTVLAESEGIHQLYRSWSKTRHHLVVDAQSPALQQGSWSAEGHQASHNQLPSDCAVPGEGWAGGPSRRDAQRPSGGRRSRRGSGGDGRVLLRSRCPEQLPARCSVRTESADGPQNGQNRPTTPDTDQLRICWSGRVFSHSPLRQTAPRSILQGGD